MILAWHSSDRIAFPAWFGAWKTAGSLPLGKSAGIKKRVYPHLFRHQIITFLTRKGIISPKLQLLSGHTEEKNLAIYRGLALADVSAEYEAAMREFPVRQTVLLGLIAASLP